MIRRTMQAKTSSVRLTFALPVNEPAGPVSVVGDFNAWTPGHTVLAKRSNGTRSATIDVPAGTEVTFRYLGTDGMWFDDNDADEVTGNGGVLRV